MFLRALVLSSGCIAVVVVAGDQRSCGLVAVAHHKTIIEQITPTYAGFSFPQLKITYLTCDISTFPCLVLVTTHNTYI